MRRSKALWITILMQAAWIWCCPSPASASKSDAVADRAKFMPVAEIEPGMVGVGYSAFSGNGQQSFRVEVIDVMRGHGPKRDLILAELEGDVVNEAGIIAGMSGSPVYIDGRLVGAVAYGWSFSKRPIAGITPIGEMLDVMNAPEVDRVSGGKHSGDDLQPHVPGTGLSAGGWSDGVYDTPLPTPELMTALTHRIGSPGSDGLVPLRVPMLVSGLSGASVGLLSDAFKDYGVHVVQGAGGGSDDRGADATFGPGDPVAIPLVRGDASIAVFGTITYAEGDRLVAFGHPVFHTGGLHLPLAGGRVIGVLPSQLQSFKFSSAYEPVGYFFSDRTPGAAGRLGTPPPMMPVTLTIHSRDADDRYEYEVVRDRFLTAPLMQSITMSTMSSELYQTGLGTMSTVTTITLADGRTITHDNVLATMSAAEMLGFRVGAPIGALVNNPIDEPHVARVDIDVTIEEEVRISSIESVEVLDRPARPGDTVRLSITLRPYRGKMRNITLPLHIPDSTEPGEKVLKVCDAIGFDAWERERAPDKFRPRTYGEFVTQLDDWPSNNGITAKLYERGASVIVGGREMPSLPPSVGGVLRATTGSGSRTMAEGVELSAAKMTLNEHVMGCHTLTLEVLKP